MSRNHLLVAHDVTTPGLRLTESPMTCSSRRPLFQLWLLGQLSWSSQKTTDCGPDLLGLLSQLNSLLLSEGKEPPLSALTLEVR